MQTFYNQLVSDQETRSPYQLWLARLTQADLPQIALLKSDLAWFEWVAETN